MSAQGKLGKDVPHSGHTQLRAVYRLTVNGTANRPAHKRARTPPSAAMRTHDGMMRA
jgi:hypothetical protein